MNPLHCHLNDTPNEIVLHIFSFLTDIDICHAAQTCKRISVLSKNETLWKNIYDNFWGKPRVYHCIARNGDIIEIDISDEACETHMKGFRFGMGTSLGTVIGSGHTFCIQYKQVLWVLINSDINEEISTGGISFWGFFPNHDIETYEQDSISEDSKYDLYRKRKKDLNRIMSLIQVDQISD